MLFRARMSSMVSLERVQSGQMPQQFFETLGTDTVPFMRSLVCVSCPPNTTRSMIGLAEQRRMFDKLS